MTKKCPKCGKLIPDESNFCLECGCHIYNNDKNEANDRFFNGKIFLILIFIILIIGGILIFSMGGGDDSNNKAINDSVHPDAKDFSINIIDVDGYEGTSNGKAHYTYNLEVLFNKVPSNKQDYMVKVTYLDENGTELGSEIEGLDAAYSSSKYGTYVGYYTSYKYIDVDHAKLEILKDDEVVKEYSAKLDKNKLDFENPKSK